MLRRKVAIHIGRWRYWKKNHITWELLHLLVTKSHNFLYNAEIQNLWFYEAVLRVCLFVFLSDTLIIFSNTENIAATYHSSLDGNSDFDVVYLSFQNTSTQTCKNSMSSNKWQLCFLYVCKLLLYRLKKWSRCISISFLIPSRGRRGVWYQALVLCFRTKVNAYYVCFYTKYRRLKGWGKANPSEELVFWLLLVSF